MHLSWLGNTCVKIQSKPAEEEISIIIDPYKPTMGDFPRNFSPSLALFSVGQKDATTLSQEPFIIDTLGEFDLKGVMINAFPGPDGVVIYKLVLEGINCVHLGKLTKKIDDETVEKLGKVDLLLIPAGGAGLLSAEDAAEVTSSLEPRIVIALNTLSDNNPKAEPISNFIKAVGLKPEVTDKKIILKHKDLPQGETKLFVLEKNI